MKEIKSTLEQLGFKHLPMLSEFVQKLVNNEPNESYGILIDISNYTDFITQPLTKGHFLPCDLDGNVLSEPKMYNIWINLEQDEWSPGYGNKCEQYQQAESRVLFEMYPVRNNIKLHYLDVCRDFDTIEQAINAGVKFTLK